MMNACSDSNIADEVVFALKTVLGEVSVPLHEPTFQGNEWKYVKECLDSTFVSSVGKFVDRFELDLASFTGAKYAVAVVNGTSALHIGLKLAGVREGDEVLLPAFTFVATANAVAYCGAIPHFIDIEQRTLGVDADKLRKYLLEHTIQLQGNCVNKSTQKVIRAIIPVHTFGHPVNMEALLAVSNEFNLTVVEDAAESLGSFYNGIHTGTFGLVGTLSFNGNKTITTGGGGAILTNEKSLAIQAKHLTTTAKLPHAWDYKHDQIAYNYRLPNLNAALGCAQLEILPDLISAKRKLFRAYYEAFNIIKGVRLFVEPEHCKSNYWLQALVIEEQFMSQRDNVLASTNKVGFMTRPAWELMHKLPAFQYCPRMDLQTSELMSKRIINIPSSPNLIDKIRNVKP